MNTKITNLSYEKLQVIPELNYKLIPEIVSFKLVNSSCAMANVIRSSVDSLPTKFLWCDITTIKTNQGIIIDAFNERLMYIPMNQYVDEDTIFEIDVINNNPAIQDFYVRSKDIKIYKGSKAVNIPICNGSFRLLKLDAGKYFNVKISIKKTNTHDAYCSPSLISTLLKYSLIEFTPVDYLDDNHSIIRVRIKTSDISDDDAKAMTSGSTVLYYSNKDNDNIIKHFNKKLKPEPSIVNKSHTLYDKIVYIKDLELFSSAMVYPTEAELSFLTYGTMPGKDIFKLLFKYLIDLYTGLIVLYTEQYCEIQGYYQEGFLLLDVMKMEKPDGNITMYQPHEKDNKLLFYMDVLDREKFINNCLKKIVNTFTSLQASM
jgi:hypothetical protein